MATPLAAGRALKRIAAAVRHRLETPVQAKERILGGPYVRSVAAIRAAIPESGAYALVEGGEPGEGGALWLRYELAPRKALDLGRAARLPLRPELDRKLPEEIRWVVVAHGRTVPPTLHSRAGFLRPSAGRQALAP